MNAYAPKLEVPRRIEERRVEEALPEDQQHGRQHHHRGDRDDARCAEG